jgi:hypothetical protein
MKIIRPLTITDAVLSASNVVEAAPAAYAGGTTYGVGDTVSVVALGTLLNVYTSLQAANIGHTPASSPTWWSLTGETYAEYDAGDTYAEGDVVIDATLHREFGSLQAANVGNDLTDQDWWLDLGATNRWKMFDQSVTSQTENPESIEKTFATVGIVDSVALLNISASTAQIIITDTVEGVVYDETFDLVDDSGVIDGYTYFFEPIVQATDLQVTGISLYADATMEIILAEAGATVRCGACVIGQYRLIGDSQAGATIGIQDYSIKQTDAFGNFTVVERTFSRRSSFLIVVENVAVDAIYRLLSSIRATPIVWIGSDRFGATTVYGFFKDFNIEIAYPEHALCSLDLEGLA